ncbi:hypothetical protein CRG98_025247 [Punica granatum]|uniref:Uncharacterized protein n=1 Tax=Punica granatum TaxID=22663 RepID=A0A2I0JDN5_PUNGR|nr:hypothetical protein CRG98_025247 [Punica granatum]
MDSSSHAIPFTEFLEDLRICMLSFLSLPEIVAFACMPSVCSQFWSLTAAAVSPSHPPHASPLPLMFFKWDLVFRQLKGLPLPGRHLWHH